VNSDSPAVARRALASVICRHAARAICHDAAVVLRRTVPGHADVPAWSGTQRDLLSLIEMVERAFQDVRASAQSERDAKRAELLSQNLALEVVDRLYPASIDADTNTWEVQASFFVLRSGEAGSGPLNELLASVSPRDLNRLYINYPSSGSGSSRSVQLWFTSGLGGTWCEVRGEDAVWVAAMAQTVQQHLNIRKPWWAWIHRRLGWVALMYFTSWTFLAVILPALPSLKKLDRLIATEIAVGLAVLVVGGAMALVNPWTLNRLLPRFELLPDGQAPTGTKRLAWAITLFLGAVLGAAASLYFTQVQL
jgi:hypothetical protein